MVVNKENYTFNLGFKGSTFPCELIQTEIFIFSFRFVWLIYLVIIVIIYYYHF